MNMFVTGATGFLGRELIEQLVEEKFRIKALTRDVVSGFPQGVVAVRGSLWDIEEWEAELKDIDCVFHVASKVGYWGEAKEYYRTNVSATRTLLDACRRYDVKRMIYTSSPSVVFDGGAIVQGDESLPYAKNFLNAYQATKAEAERNVLAANAGGFTTCALRPHMIWGIGDKHLLPRLLSQAKAGKLRIIGEGKNEVSVCHVRNAAHAHVIASKSDNIGGKAYFVNDPVPVLLWEWIQEILRGVGYGQKLGRVPAALAYQAGSLLELAHKLLGIKNEPLLTRYTAALLGISHSFSIKNAKNDFRYDSIVEPRDGVQEVIHHFKSRCDERFS
jgi:nucleoside-diphosphate-sugar epimerase